MVRLFKAQIMSRSFLFMLTNMGGKAMAAVAQLYAIFVFARVYSQEDTAVIFLLFGYSIWFQIFDLGLAQTLQNKFNSRQISGNDALKLLLFQFLFVLVFALIALKTSALTDLLVSESRKGASEEAVEAFTIGASVLLIASNNAITQRLLLVFNKGQLANILILSQSVLAIISLVFFYYSDDKPNLSLALLYYLGPQILVYMPVLVTFLHRLATDKTRHHKNGIGSILIDSLGFWGLGILSVLYLGMDYYFAAHYLSADEVVSYHLAARVFFVSYVPYYAFVQHRARRLSFLSKNSAGSAVASMFKDSATLGMGSVLIVFFFAVALEGMGAFALMTNADGMSLQLLSFACLYFSVRACRDVAVVIASGLNSRRVLCMVYTSESAVCLILMSIMVPSFGGVGIFGSMFVASSVGLILLIYQARKLGYQFL